MPYGLSCATGFARGSPYWSSGSLAKPAALAPAMNIAAGSIPALRRPCHRPAAGGGLTQNASKRRETAIAYQRSSGRRRTSLITIASRMLCGSRSMATNSFAVLPTGDRWPGPWSPPGCRSRHRPNRVVERLGDSATASSVGLVDVLRSGGAVGLIAAAASRLCDAGCQRARPRLGRRVSAAPQPGERLSRQSVALRTGFGGLAGGLAGAGRFVLVSPRCCAARRRNSPTSSSTRCLSAGGCGGGLTRACCRPWPVWPPAISPPAALRM